MSRILLFTLASLLVGGQLSAQWGGGEKYPDLKPHPEAMESFQDMRLGIFMHWGPSILRGTSSWGRGNHPYDFAPKVPISEYDSLYLQFNPVLFDAADWISTVRKSGAKYYVITTKHHDGFCIWDSDYTDYDIMSTPYKRDVLKELSAECEKQGILFGTYYSICDWHHPDYPGRYGNDPRPIESSDLGRYKEYMYHQLDELIDRYHTKILWFDGSWESPWTHEDGMDLYKYLRDKQDRMIINNRVDKRKSIIGHPELKGKLAGDYKTPEQEIGEYDNEMPWESCITISGSWHFNPTKLCKTLPEVIHLLVQTAGGGGNLLLNVGPMPDGRIEMVQKQRLMELGRWMEKYGETIYGTQGGPFKPNEYLACTRKDKQFFLHIMDWPEETIVIPGINHIIKDIKGFNEEEIRIDTFPDRLELTVQKENRHPINTVLRFDLKEDAMNLGDLDPLLFKDLKTVSLSPEPADKFKANGQQSLINKKLADPFNFYDEWLGFEQASPEIIINLGSQKSIHAVQVGCLNSQPSWIFTPKRIKVLISNDNKNFEPIADRAFQLIRESQGTRHELAVDLPQPTQAQFIKIIIENQGVCPDWHKGSGGKAWLLIDEIEVLTD